VFVKALRLNPPARTAFSWSKTSILKFSLFGGSLWQPDGLCLLPVNSQPTTQNGTYRTIFLPRRKGKFEVPVIEFYALTI
jgi:hypothetical protein